MKRWHELHGNDDVYKPFNDAVKAAQDQMDEIAKWQAEQGTDEINSELLNKKLQAAMGKVPEFNNSLPEMPEMSNEVDTSAAMAQMDASGAADNPMSQGFNNIEMGENNIGTLPVTEKGIEGPLAKVLMENSDKLTEGNMGWNPNDPRWGGDVSKWASSRAHGIVAEKYPNISGLDKNIPENTKFEVDFSNPADIQLDPDGKLEPMWESLKSVESVNAITETASPGEIAQQVNDNMHKLLASMGDEIMKSSNIASTPMSVFEGSTNDAGIVGKVHSILENAKRVLPDGAGNFQENETVSKYTMRIMKEATRKGEVENIFGKL
jgi:hypothetical protein